MQAEARYFGNSEYVACLGNIFDRNFAAQLRLDFCGATNVHMRNTWRPKWKILHGNWGEGGMTISSFIREFCAKFSLIESSPLKTCTVSIKFIPGQPSKIIGRDLRPRLPGKGLS